MPDQVKYTSKLNGTRILIIGGSSGIGFAVAEASIENGADHIIISSSNPDRVKLAVSRLRHAYPSTKCEITGHPCDLAQEDALESNIAKLFEFATSGGTVKLDHVISSAGDSLAVKPLEEMDFAYIKKAGMTRFFAPLLIAKAAMKFLSPGPASSITLTTGMVSEKPIPNWSVVGSYATGLQGMARQLALDLKPSRVNVVSPGAVDTELWDYLPEDSRKALKDSFAKTTTTGVIGTPEDLAESYLYCMKDHNLTGSMISSNGGGMLV